MKSRIFDKDGIPTIKVLDPQELKEFTLIDVRRDDEFTGELGHIKGASLKTLGIDFENHMKELASKGEFDKKILFICRSGARSAKTTLDALNMGFTQVYNMEGGMIYWNESGYPTEK